MELPIAIINNEGERGLVLHGSETENMISFEQLTKQVSIEIIIFDNICSINVRKAAGVIHML